MSDFSKKRPCVLTRSYLQVVMPFRCIALNDFMGQLESVLHC